MTKHNRIQEMIAKTVGIAAVASLAIVPAAAAQQAGDQAQTPSAGQSAAPAEQQPSSPATQPQAAQPQSAQPQGGDPVTSAAVSDEEVEQFTKAYMEVRKVQDEAKASGDAADAQQQATEKMSEIISDHDLTVERYNQIARSLAEDQALMQRVQSKMAELQAEEGGASSEATRPEQDNSAQ